MTGELSSSLTASTSQQYAFQQEMIRSIQLGCVEKRWKPAGKQLGVQRNPPGSLLPTQDNPSSQYCGCEPATACLEGRVAQDRRQPGMNRHVRPIEQLRSNFVRR